MTDADTILASDIGREELLAELRALMPAFAREGVQHMALVGSRARGDNRRDSDVDLMIDVEADRRFSLVEVARIIRLVQDRIGLRADILMRRSLSPHLLATAEQDQVRVF